MNRDRLVVALAGDEGVGIGVRLLQALAATTVESHVVITAEARAAIPRETGLSAHEVLALATRTYREDNQAAAISSGSFLVRGMIVAPCGRSTLAAIANGFAGNLVGRAADVTLKEGRPLSLAIPESPLSPMGLENLVRLSGAGATILLPAAAADGAPESMEEMLDRVVSTLLDRFGVGDGTTRAVRAPDATSGAAGPN